MNGERWSSSLSVELRSDGVGVIRFDVTGEALNTLQSSFAEEFSGVLARLAQESALKALVFTSGKPDSFIAGADIQMLAAVQQAEQAAELSRAGQRALSALANYRVPVVAAIHGACLGGGLELALACSARVASSEPETKFGLPEVQLGILPALGGTQRLPRLVGIENALDLLLSGRQIDAKRALAMGLLDELVPKSILLEVAVRSALARANEPRARRSRVRRWFERAELKELLLVENPLGRKLLFEKAEKQLLQKTHGNYPAPERILEVVKLGFSAGELRGLEAEASAFGELVVSDSARALRHVFFASTQLKKDSGHDVAGVQARPIRRVATLGAGSMGAGIAYLSAAVADAEVRIKDRDDATIGRGLKSVRQILDERVSARRMTASERDLKMARVTATTTYEGFEAVDLVIEAVFEDLSLKRQVLAEIERNTPKTTIFASNTSSIPIQQIAAGARRPEQVIGMHYFSPAERMPLLEVVITEQTVARVIASSVEFGKRQGKTVIVVRDGPGFYTSRILGPYLNEAAFLIAEGVPIEQIDAALVAWGFPVGPLTLLDEIGIDVATKVAHVLHEALGARMAPSLGTEALLKDERLGAKNQRGFYAYSEPARGPRAVDASVYSLLGVEPKGTLPAAEIAERCALRMLNEAAHCFAEGILRSARDGDVGAIFGLGFPAFRGGPFHLADALGAARIVNRLEDHASAFGERFSPAPILVEMAKTGGTFHGPRAVSVGRPLVEERAR
ncbi:MAG TPA: fatty acid oxidation complex subunit alpha FadJ [Polyangiaceae bacterium]|nr:fatty acid oxidation complex subunit alpha FadJ [Polyangiaceae bacterium]